MTMSRVLVAVDDSPAALEAARVAVALAALLPARIRFVHVLGDGELARRFHALRRDGTPQQRRAEASASLLTHVLSLAGQARVAAEGADLAGDPATVLLTDAGSWEADLVVLGRSGQRGPGRSYVGATAQHVLEFSEVPVLLVPKGDR